VRRTRPGGAERHLPAEGLVPYRGRVLRIRFWAQPEDGVYTYTLQDPDSGRNVAHNVPHAELLAHLPPYAQYSVGDHVALANGRSMTVYKRQWDFRGGTVWYLVLVPGGKEEGYWLSQEKAMALDQALDPVWRR
jgi:hypothetical protein